MIGTQGNPFKKLSFAIPAVLLAVIVCALITAVIPVQAKELCSKDTLYISVNERSDGADFFLKNLETFEITVTIDFLELKNARANVSLPYTVTLMGGESLKAFSINQVSRMSGWRYRYCYNWISGNTDAEHDDSYVYRLPYPSAKRYKVTQGFNGSFSHQGNSRYAIDWSMPEGSTVCAARGGTVIGVRDQNWRHGNDESYKDFNNLVMIRHSDGTIGEYDHFMKDGVKVRVGQKVKPGDVIGLSGNTGYTSGPHLHFFVYRAIDGKTRETFPIKYCTTESEAEILENGKYYTCP